MYAIFVPIDVKPECRDAFVEVSLTEARDVMRTEADCLCFKVMVDQNQPNRFHFFEIFISEAAAKAHWKTEVFKTWYEAAQDMMVGDIGDTIEMDMLFPANTMLHEEKALSIPT